MRYQKCIKIWHYLRFKGTIPPTVRRSSAFVFTTCMVIYSILRHLHKKCYLTAPQSQTMFKIRRQKSPKCLPKVTWCLCKSSQHVFPSFNLPFCTGVNRPTSTSSDKKPLPNQIGQNEKQKKVAMVPPNKKKWLLKFQFVFLFNYYGRYKSDVARFLLWLKVKLCRGLYYYVAYNVLWMNLNLIAKHICAFGIRFPAFLLISFSTIYKRCSSFSVLV